MASLTGPRTVAAASVCSPVDPLARSLRHTSKARAWSLCCLPVAASSLAAIRRRPRPCSPGSLKLALAIVAALLALGTLAIQTCGCSSLTVRSPAGEALSWIDTKDNSVRVASVEYDPATKRVSIRDLEVINNASGPVNAWMTGLANLTAQLTAALGRVQMIVDSRAPTSQPS